jgi:molybdate transport system ATP-binding protein
MAGEIAVDLVHRFESGVQVRASFARPTARGSILVVFGPSGAGKTTILRAIAGLLRPHSGRVVVDGREWFDSGAQRFVPPQERRVGYVAQDTALFPHLSVRANVEYGLRAAAPAARRQRASEMLELVGVRGLEDRLPRQLSGGQAQRVALARALAPSPALLLLDEPFGALDAATRRGLRSEVRGVLRDTGTSAILVTHDRLEAMAMGDDLAVMVDGELRQIGSVQEVFRSPSDPGVARALGVETVVPAVAEGERDGLVTLRIGDARLVAVAGADLPAGAEVFACMRAEDVNIQIVQRGLPGGPGGVHVDVDVDVLKGSARNHLAGRVVGIENEGAIDRVTVDCGFPLVAAITRQSSEELALGPGSGVTVAIKATAIHVVPKI